jgi:hypothetical protein
VATKRAVRAMLNANEVWATEPDPARFLLDRG